MADKKISALTSSTTPLAGTEVLPIVQGGATVKVSVANLTAGRSVSASEVRVGGSSSADVLKVLGRTSDGYSLVVFMDSTAAVNRAYLGSPAVDEIALFDGSFNERLRMTSAGDIKATTGNFVVGTSGKGIDFSATPGTGTSELLADYEEGTWTPALTGPASQTYTSTGYYVKVGSTVLIQGIITWTVAPSGGSNYRVALPFGSTTNKPENVNFVMVGLNTAAALVKYFDVYQNSSNGYFRDASGTAYNYAGLFGTGSVAFSGVYSTT
jgi:hypothetical protein